MEAMPLVEAAEWLEQYRKVWEETYARLDTLLAELTALTPSPDKKKN